LPDNENSSAAQEVSEERLPAQLRVINAANGTAPLNVFVGISAIATNLSPTQFTAPVTVDSGETEARIQLSGSRPNDAPIARQVLDIPSGDSLLLVTGTQEALILEIVPLELLPTSPDSSTFTLINALSDGQNVALQQDDRTLIGEVGAGRTGSSAEVSTELINLSLVSGTTSLEVSSELSAQENIFLVASGTSASLQVSQFSYPAPLRIDVRVIHAATNLGPVDITIDEQPFNTNVQFGRPTERQSFRSGNHQITIHEAGNAEPFYSEVIVLEEASPLAIVLLGSTENLDILIYTENLEPTIAGQFRISFLHTVGTPDTIAITMNTAGNAPHDLGESVYDRAPLASEVNEGTYSIGISGAITGNAGIIETAEDKQFVQGTSYLYLVSGRQDNNPIILSESVGTTDPMLEVDQANVMLPAYLRFINAHPSTPFRVNLNGNTVVEALAAETGTELIPVTTRNNNNIQVLSGDTIVVDEFNNFEQGRTYTIVIYAIDAQAYLLTLSDRDLIFDGVSPHLRLINMTAIGDADFGLALGVARPLDEAPAAEPSVEASQESERFSMPAGLTRMVSGIEPLEASGTLLLAEGAHNIYIFDRDRFLAGALAELTLTGDQHVDIIIDEMNAYELVRIFAVPYPTRPE
jgi:hypothetical protein